ncbi:DUF4097 family beta strand repeat-containing protein [Amycolatopsis granulosa]|uniref:DUF4097 family beta strand repeat-containing protein n=1 Tax=Amycolatopsis granulosa TaxID=185684 RepID=UPI00141F3076|nr:DUF4097 family beta strand repeat-containing protein [Amycolatopsis granulosa]NIH83195.1 DUF4097 and DUF4098 domain-containing protein YvlB [Amycolatopsis granulosa]
MPVFDTPGPIDVTIDLAFVRDLRIVASDRADTVTEVRPSAGSDAKVAQQIRVEYAAGRLQISGPKIGALGFSRKTRRVDVTVELPTGSQISGEVQVGGLHATGRLGEVRFKTSGGNCRLDHTGPLHLVTAAGHVTVGHVAGDAEIRTGSGTVRVGDVEGTAVAQNSNGHITFDTVAGDVRMRTANGDLVLDRAGAGVEAKTVNGGIRLGEVARGAVTLETGTGDLKIGIADGTAAWLDVHTGSGHVRNLLDEAPGPAEAAETVEVRGHTSFGEVTVHRS